VVIKSPGGEELNLRSYNKTGATAATAPVPSSPGFTATTFSRPERKPAVRLESEETRLQRIALEADKAKEREMIEKSKQEAADKIKREQEEQERKAKEEEELKRKALEEEERRKKALEEEEERKRKAKQEEEEERLRLEEEARAEERRKEEEEKLRKEREEQEIARKAEEERQHQEEEWKRQEEERLRQEEEERQRKESAGLREEQEHSERDLEQENAEVEVDEVEVAEAEESDTTAGELEEGEIEEPDPDEVFTPVEGKDDSLKDKLKEGLRIDTASPLPSQDIHRKSRPDPLNLTQATRSAVSPSLPSALATARNISDLSNVSYPEGISSPKPELNSNAKEGKFRLVLLIQTQIQPSTFIFIDMTETFSCSLCRYAKIGRIIYRD
jgi:translation initiation factor 4G